MAYFMIANRRKNDLVERAEGNPFDFSQLKDVKVKVGSSYWSIHPCGVDRLLMDAKIDFIQYLERFRRGDARKRNLIKNSAESAASRHRQSLGPLKGPITETVTADNIH